MRRVLTVLVGCFVLASCGTNTRNFAAAGGGAGSGDAANEAGKGGGAPAGGHPGVGGDSEAAGADGGAAGAADGGAADGTGVADGNAAGVGGAGGNAAGAGGNAAGAGGSGPSCGNGIIDPGEKCDAGPNNGSGKACNASCQPNVCGDGDVGPGEVCDKGAENGLELARCAPDCSRIIQIKHIKLGPERPNGNLQPNPVATADADCPVGYKALFAYASVRRATTSPNKVANPIDWVIQPYTYYVNDTENPLWLTDEVALLGVRKGVFARWRIKSAGG